MRPSTCRASLLTGQVSASYFFGKPVAGGQVALRLVGMRLGQDPAAGETLLFSEELLGESDANGQFSFQFQLPELPDDAFGSSGAIDLALEATVVDAAGDAQFGWQSLTLAREPILIDVAPEDGTLHAGVENVIYVLTSYPDGRPAPTALQVQIGSGALIEEDTNDFGVAQVRYTPRAGAEGDHAITVTATDAAGQTGSTSLVLPLDEAQETLLLRTDRALYQVGDTLAVEAIATGSGPAVYVDVIKGGQTLLTQSALVEDGKATLAIDLTPALAGTLELNAYQLTGDNNILRDTRVALVDATRGRAGAACHRPGRVSPRPAGRAQRQNDDRRRGRADGRRAGGGQRGGLWPARLSARLRPRLLPAGPGAASQRRGPARCSARPSTRSSGNCARPSN